MGLLSDILIGALIGLSLSAFEPSITLDDIASVTVERVQTPSATTEKDTTKDEATYEEVVEQVSLDTEIKTKAYITSTNYDFINIIGSVSQENFDLMLGKYCEIPLALREEFQLSDWVLSMTNERLEDTWFKHMSVPVCAGSASVLKEIRMEDSYNGATAVIHDFGHYYSYSHGNLYYTDEFLNLYASEGGCVSSYASTNSDECFAEAFEMYIVSPSKLERNAPSIYTYFKNLLG